MVKNKKVEIEIARLLVDSYMKDINGEIKIVAVGPRFRLEVMEEVHNRIDFIEEIYSKSKIAKKEFLKLMNDSLDTSRMLNSEINAYFRGTINAYREQVENDVDELISKKRIKL